MRETVTGRTNEHKVLGNIPFLAQFINNFRAKNTRYLDVFNFNIRICPVQSLEVTFKSFIQFLFLLKNSNDLYRKKIMKMPGFATLLQWRNVPHQKHLSSIPVFNATYFAAMYLNLFEDHLYSLPGLWLLSHSAPGKTAQQ